MRKVLMVCLGNICRSPLAEGVLKSKVSPEKFYVDSAGTGSYHIGNPPDKRSIKIAKDHGIDISNQKCRQFSIDDFEKFTDIYVMDESNYQDILSLTDTESEKEKVKLIMNEVYKDENFSVPDPYYGGEEGFEKVFQMLDKACEVIANKNT